MSNSKLEIFNGHPIINDGENTILIDTGSPATIHDDGIINFCSTAYICSKNYMGLTVAKVSEMLGKNISALLGTDILSNYKILFDYNNKVVTFHEQEVRFEGEDTPISNFMGIPVIALSIDGQELNFFLDTGAKLSYLPASITSKYSSIGTEEDFYPEIGKFDTECFEISTSIGNKKFIVKYGNLPALLQMSLMLGGTDGIIGFDFFNHFKALLDLKSNKLKYA